MQAEKIHAGCSKKIELLVLTREEDFKELSRKIAEVQKQQHNKIDALAQRITLLEESLARSRRLARAVSK